MKAYHVAICDTPKGVMRNGGTWWDSPKGCVMRHWRTGWHDCVVSWHAYWCRWNGRPYSRSVWCNLSSKRHWCTNYRSSWSLTGHNCSSSGWPGRGKQCSRWARGYATWSRFLMTGSDEQMPQHILGLQTMFWIPMQTLGNEVNEVNEVFFVTP